MDEYFEEEDILVRKYELLIYENKSVFFDIDEFEQIAYHYMMQGKFDKAFEAVEKAELCYPNNGEVLFIKAKVFIADEKLPEALELLKKLEHEQPEWASVNILKGKAYLMIDDEETALSEFRLAVTKETSEIDDIALNIADLLTSSDKHDHVVEFLSLAEQDADTLYLTAINYERNGNNEKAAEYFEKSLDEDPFNEVSWVSLGLLHERCERYEEALQAFDFALTINEHNEPAMMGKAGTLIQADRIDEAEEILHTVLKESPDNQYALYSLAECKEKRLDFDGAMIIFGELIHLYPNFSDSYWGLANVLIKQNDLDSAAKAIEKAIDIEPDSADFWFTKGEIMLKSGAAEEALKAYLTSEELYSDPETGVIIAKLLEETSPSLALDHLLKLLEEFPNSMQIKCNAAILYYKTGDIENCVKTIKLAGNTDPDCMKKFYHYCPDAILNNEINEAFTS